MSNQFVTKLANQLGKSVYEVERVWRQSKRQATSEGHAKNYAHIAAITKKNLGLITESPKDSTMKSYKGAQVEVLSSTPDTALIKVVGEMEDKDLQKLADAADGKMTVPLRDLKEMTTVPAVGSAQPTQVIGQRKNKKKPSVGAKVKTSSGKYGVITIHGNTHSMVGMLDSKGNPTDTIKRMANNAFSLAESVEEPEPKKDLSIAEMAKLIASGADPDTLVEEATAPITPAEVLVDDSIECCVPPSSELLSTLLGVLGIDLEDVSDEQLAHAIAVLDQFELEREDDVVPPAEIPLSAPLGESKLNEYNPASPPGSGHYPQGNTTTTTPIAAQTAVPPEREVTEPSEEADDVGDLDDSDLSIVQSVVDPDLEDDLIDDPNTAPDATPDADVPAIPKEDDVKDVSDEGDSALLIPQQESTVNEDQNLAMFTVNALRRKKKQELTERGKKKPVDNQPAKLEAVDSTIVGAQHGIDSGVKNKLAFLQDFS